MKNTYLDSLKETYDSPQKAWLAYTLQKNFWKVAVCSEDALLEVKKSVLLQQKTKTTPHI